MTDAGTGLQARLGAAGVTPAPDVDGGAVAALPVPTGWVDVGAEVLPAARTVLAAVDRSRAGWSPNAVLLDHRLSGPVDPAAVLPGAIVDARAMPGWTTEIDRIDRTPAGDRALVRGTYEAEGFLARVTLALVLAADGETGGQRLFQLTVTVPADADDMLDAVDEMVDGLRVA